VLNFRIIIFRYSLCSRLRGLAIVLLESRTSQERLLTIGYIESEYSLAGNESRNLTIIVTIESCNRLEIISSWEFALEVFRVMGHGLKAKRKIKSVFLQKI
jgi:hypothetical protein